jgi:hypothetical protein
MNPFVIDEVTKVIVMVANPEIRFDFTLLSGVASRL